MSVDILHTNQRRNGVADWKGGVDAAEERCRCHRLKHVGAIAYVYTAVVQLYKDCIM